MFSTNLNSILLDKMQSHKENNFQNRIPSFRKTVLFHFFSRTTTLLTSNMYPRFDESSLSTLPLKAHKHMIN